MKGQQFYGIDYDWTGRTIGYAQNGCLSIDWLLE
jgi:hypothetical protein